MAEDHRCQTVLYVDNVFDVCALGNDKKRSPDIVTTLHLIAMLAAQSRILAFFSGSLLHLPTVPLAPCRLSTIAKAAAIRVRHNDGSEIWLPSRSSEKCYQNMTFSMK